MKSRWSWRMLLPLAALLQYSAPVDARIETVCGENQTLLDCEEAARNEVLPPLTDVTPVGNQLVQAGTNLLDEVQDRLLKLPIGAAVGPALTTTTSLLPRFSLAGLPDTNHNGGALRGDWNLALPGAEANNSQLRLLTAPAPELAKPVKEAAAAAGASVDALKAQLDATDDLSAEFTWSLRGHGFGRDLDQYRNNLSSMMLQVFGALPKHEDALLNAFDTNGCLNVEAGDDIMSYTPKQLAGKLRKRSKDGAPCKELLDAAVEELPAAAQRDALLLKSFAAQRAVTGLDRFADLVSNQPQLTVTLARSERVPLVGAKSTSVRIGYETGWVNLNGFLRGDGEACLTGGKLGWGRAPDDATANDSCVEAYQRYVDRNVDNGRLDAQDRLSAWLEYAHLDDMDLAAATDGVDLTIEGGERYSAGIGYGRVLWSEQAAQLSTRIDATGRYERYENDHARQDRLLYSVVLTQRVGLLNIPLVLAYGDKAEYKGSEDDGLLATLGLSYDFGLPEAPALPQAVLDRAVGVVPTL